MANKVITDSPPRDPVTISRRMVVSKGRVQGEGLELSMTNISDGNKTCQGQIKINPLVHRQLMWQRRRQSSNSGLHNQ